MVPDGIFIVKFNTRPLKKENFFFSAPKLRQGCQIVYIDVSFDRPIQYLCNEVIFDGSGRHFHGEIQHLKQVWKFYLSAHNLW